MTQQPDKLDEILDKLTFAACDYEAGRNVDLDKEFTKARAEIEKHYISRQKLEKAIPAKKPTLGIKQTTSSTIISRNQGYNQALADIRQNLGLEEKEE